MCNTLRVLDFFASLHLTIFERPVNFEFFSQLTGRPKTAICCVSEKNPDRLSVYDRASWIFLLPCISPYF
jgi:hypothetical protein